MDRKRLTVAAHPDIGRMTVQTVARQQVAMVHGDTLALVDGGGVAVIDVGVVLQVEADLAALAIEADREAGGVDLLDGSERAVLHPHRTLVAQEHHPIAGCERPLAALGRHQLVGAEPARALVADIP